MCCVTASKSQKCCVFKKFERSKINSPRTASPHDARARRRAGVMTAVGYGQRLPARGWTDERYASAGQVSGTMRRARTSCHRRAPRALAQALRMALGPCTGVCPLVSGGGAAIAVPFRGRPRPGAALHLCLEVRTGPSELECNHRHARRVRPYYSLPMRRLCHTAVCRRVACRVPPPGWASLVYIVQR